MWAFGFHAGNWHPLAWISHMLDCQLYGLNPAGHHLTNALLHAANTALLFLLLHRLTGFIWRSAAVAALFGWHPLHVESVAWVAERKDVLCALFWMLTLLAYVRYTRCLRVRNRRAGLSYCLALLLFILALMSKPMAVTLPFVLLLLDFWPLQRASWNVHPVELRAWGLLVGEKIPFFLLSGAVCLLTMHAQDLAIVPTEALSFKQRVIHALLSYTHYLLATFWPRGLAVYYPYPTIVPLSQAIFAGCVFISLTIAALWSVRRRPYFFVGWFWFVGTLVPVIGLVQVGDQAWADRYTYLPLIGVFLVVVWAAVEWLRDPRLLSGTAVVMGLALLAGTTVQLRYWRNTQTLFQHAAEVVPDNYMAITMLGSLMAKDGKLDDAIWQYRAALNLKPGFPEAHFFLGNALEKQGMLDEAIAEYRQALWFKPFMGTTHILLGAALAKKGDYDEAVAHYKAAIKLDSESAIAQNNLARVLQSQGKVDEAIEHYHTALKLDPKLAEAHNNLGIALLQKNRVADGVAELRESLRLNPTNAESQFNLALGLNQQEQWEEAARLFSNTVAAASPDPNAHYQFAMALANSGQTRQAMAQYAAALLLRPDFPEALNGLAWILCTTTNSELRNAGQAVGMAEQACELTGRRDPAKLKTLAAAYAEAGRFQEAATTAQTAQKVAAGAGRDALAKECGVMADAFGRSRPWRATNSME